MQEKSLFNFPLSMAYPGSRAWPALNNKQKYFSFPDHQLGESFDSYFWFLLKQSEEMITFFVTEFLKIAIINIFI